MNTPWQIDNTCDLKTKSNAILAGDSLTKLVKNESLTRLIHDEELERKQILNELHKTYESKFKELFYTTTAPKDSLNRFLLEQLSLGWDKSKDKEYRIEYSSCLNQTENIVMMDTLSKEINTAYPLIGRATKLASNESVWFKAKRKIDEYLQMAQIFLKNDNNKLNDDNKKRSVKDTIENYAKVFKTIDNESQNEESILKSKSQFREVYDKCYDYFKSRCDLKIKEICEFLNDILKTTSNKLVEVAQKITIDDIRSKPPNVRKIDRSTEISYNGCSFKIDNRYFDKLGQLYRINAVDRLGLEYNKFEFNSCVFSLICRYESFFQNSISLNEGYGMQAALPSNSFKLLNELFDVSQEMFASPFNCYFSQFCSAFFDTDIYFGSQGSFFDYEPIGGSFQCFPPSTEECIERMADHIDHLLKVSKDHPLSFIVFIPEWLDPPTPGLVKMDASSFLRKSLILPGSQHKYITGAQHIETSKPKYYNSAHNTKVYFLQNDLAFEKWKPTEEKIKKFTERVVSSVDDNRPYNNFYRGNRQFESNSNERNFNNYSFYKRNFDTNNSNGLNERSSSFSNKAYDYRGKRQFESSQSQERSNSNIINKPIEKRQFESNSNEKNANTNKRKNDDSDSEGPSEKKNKKTEPPVESNNEGSSSNINNANNIIIKPIEKRQFKLNSNEKNADTNKRKNDDSDSEGPSEKKNKLRGLNKSDD